MILPDVKRISAIAAAALLVLVVIFFVLSGSKPDIPEAVDPGSTDRSAAAGEASASSSMERVAVASDLVELTVVDAAGRPVANARFQAVHPESLAEIDPSSAPVSISDQRGVARVAAGLVLRVVCDGFLSTTVSDYADGDRVVLERGFRLTVRFVDREGQGVAGVPVRVIPARSTEPDDLGMSDGARRERGDARSGGTMDVARSDSNGVATFSAMKPGIYLVDAESENHVVVSGLYQDPVAVRSDTHLDVQVETAYAVVWETRGATVLNSSLAVVGATTTMSGFAVVDIRGIQGALRRRFPGCRVEVFSSSKKPHDVTIHCFTLEYGVISRTLAPVAVADLAEPTILDLTGDPIPSGSVELVARYESGELVPFEGAAVLAKSKNAITASISHARLVAGGRTELPTGRYTLFVPPVARSCLLQPVDELGIDVGADEVTRVELVFDEPIHPYRIVPRLGGRGTNRIVAATIHRDSDVIASLRLQGQVLWLPNGGLQVTASIPGLGQGSTVFTRTAPGYEVQEVIVEIAP
jgi:protocatechuate 3,4-dioxygenase beta subunit